MSPLLDLLQGRVFLRARACLTPVADRQEGAEPTVLLHLTKRIHRENAPGRADDTHPQTMFGEWLSLVEHLVRDQGVGGSNPLSPTIRINHLH
jgi:hypothetical protein